MRNDDCANEPGTPQPPFPARGAQAAARKNVRSNHHMHTRAHLGRRPSNTRQGGSARLTSSSRAVSVSLVALSPLPAPPRMDTDAAIEWRVDALIHVRVSRPGAPLSSHDVRLDSGVNRGPRSLLACVGPQSPDVSFIPSALIPPVLSAARLERGDEFIDLGCGSGKLVLAAAATPGVHAGAGNTHCIVCVSS